MVTPEHILPNKPSPPCRSRKLKLLTALHSDLTRPLPATIISAIEVIIYKKYNLFSVKQSKMISKILVELPYLIISPSRNKWASNKMTKVCRYHISIKKMFFFETLFCLIVWFSYIEFHTVFNLYLIDGFLQIWKISVVLIITVAINR